MNLYIPVETAARELDGKLLLALRASARGYKVVLGNRSMMSNIMHRFEPGSFKVALKRRAACRPLGP